MPSFGRWRVWGLLLMVPLDPTEEPTIVSQYKASMERLARLDDTDGANDKAEDENLIAVNVDGSTKGVEPYDSHSTSNPLLSWLEAHAGIIMMPILPQFCTMGQSSPRDALSSLPVDPLRQLP